MKKECDPYVILKMEYPGIKEVISDYSGGGIIKNYLNSMESALACDSVTEVCYFLDKICTWYDENISKISTNEFVYNMDEHNKVNLMVHDLNKQLKDYDFSQIIEKKTVAPISGNKVFVVHGHDNEAKIEVARTIDLLGCESIILHEQADEGKTIIEKLETYTADVAFAVVLYTECDLGRSKELKEEANRYRARQNVVFEHGLFIGALGRSRVCALVKGNVERPGDIDGVVYITMDEAGAWKMQLCKNMKAAGVEVDANKLL